MKMNYYGLVVLLNLMNFMFVDYLKKVKCSLCRFCRGLASIIDENYYQMINFRERRPNANNP